MKKAVTGISVLFILMFVLSGCADNDNAETPAQPRSTPITTPKYTPVTVLGQFIPSSDGAVAPGMANYWDIDTDFSIDDQFDTFLGLSVGATAFPADQVQSELIYYTPAMDAADGAMTVSVSNDTTSWHDPIAGNYSAYLYPTGNSILKQTVNLTAATGTVTFSCSLAGFSGVGNIPGGPDTFRIVVRNRAGAERAVLYSATNTSVNPVFADLTPYLGEIIVLSFEHNGQWEPIVVDNVSVLDSNTTEFITNGSFESGTLAPWTVNPAANMLQNVTAGIRTVEGLEIIRSFYTVPNKLWGRWVDVFSNPTGADITTTVSYSNNLGSDYFGIIYSTPNANNQAVTSWDGSAFDRDIAFVYGNATSVTFTSDDGLGNGNGSDLIPTTYNITVPVGGTVAIVNFIVMDGTDTGQTAVDITATADEVDAVAAAIVTDFWTDPQYRKGMTQKQIDAISNF